MNNFKINKLQLETEIAVGDKIQWYNKALNQRRKGTVTRIDDSGVYVTTEGGVKAHITKNLESIFKL